MLAIKELATLREFPWQPGLSVPSRYYTSIMERLLGRPVTFEETHEALGHGLLPQERD